MTTILLIIAFLISLLISILIGKGWIKATSNNTTINLSAEALRNPINTGITVSGFLLPLIVGIMTFSFANKGNPVQKDFYIVSSIVLIIVSIFIGLWNNYALATLTDTDGKFKITSNDNTTFPAFFVFQLSLLFFAIIYFGLFGYCNIKQTTNKKNSEKIITQNHGNILINKTFVPVNNHKSDLLKSWGTPNEIIDNDSIDLYFYTTSKYDFIYEIKNDTIININQKAKK